MSRPPRCIARGVWSLAAAALMLAALPACMGPVPNIPADLPSRYGYEVVAAYPHDPAAFTQGLEYHNGFLYESTGLRGESSLRRVDLESGEVLQRLDLDRQYFGEGLTILDGRIYQLTWTSRTAFVYDLDTFALLDTFSYGTEGWGLANDGERLIMSDGSANLYFRDPHDFSLLGVVEVTHDGVPVTLLNELEYIDGEVYANIWDTRPLSVRREVIAIINPETGEVRAWLDLAGLFPHDERGPGVDVLNGIAHDREGGRLFVTGKRWPHLYEIRMIPADSVDSPAR